MATKSDSLKIGLILDTSLDPMDGVQQYVVGIGEWLRSRGHDVHYLVGQTQERQLPNIHSLSRNISVVFNGNRTTIPLPASRRKLRKLIHQENFDLLHVQTPHHPLMAQHLIMAAGSQTAVVATFHILPYGWLSKFGNRLLGIWLKPSLRRIDAMLSVSTAAAEFSKKSFGLDSEVVPNVIDYQLFHNPKPLAKYTDGKLTILFLGRLVPRKGCQLLLEAVAKLSKQDGLPPFRVVVCGKGPLMPQLKRYVSNNQLNEIVEFSGFVDEIDKPSYYASADISVFPSGGGESFGIVLLEAMASGKAAVLAGDNPGYRSVLAPRQEMLFDPRDADQLAIKLRELLTDDAKRQAAAEWGGSYTKHFDVNVVGQQLEQIYRQALRKRRRA